MEGVLVCLYAITLHGVEAEADSTDATRFTRAPTRGENRKPMRRVKTKRGGDRDVRGWFASNHRR